MNVFLRRVYATIYMCVVCIHTYTQYYYVNSNRKAFMDKNRKQDPGDFLESPTFINIPNNYTDKHKRDKLKVLK